MSKKVKFKFEKLQYEIDAVNSVINLFNGVIRNTSSMYPVAHKTLKGIKRIDSGEPIRNPGIIEGARLAENLKRVQLNSKNIFLSDYSKEGNNFTIEMETGTGKTYVYLRTILELNKQYKFNKFMIVVPSVAIRTGVWKSIEMLKDEFVRLYGIDLTKHSFIYDSNNMGKISTNLVETRDLSICIINIQAFNKDSNKIRQEDEYGNIIWEDIKGIRPIIIIDEPQKIEGTAKKISKSAQVIEDVNPLFKLRYSATHKRLYNQVYKLDSYDAYKEDLVKKIEVKTINSTISKKEPYIKYLEFTSDLKAKIEIFRQEQSGRIKFRTFSVRGNTSLYDLSGGLEQYRDMRIGEDPHKLKPLNIVTKSSDFELKLGESNMDTYFKNRNVIKTQIEITIREHLDKQFKILDAGKKIKVLSLFFIDEVAKVRNNDADDGRGEFLILFDETYKKVINEEKYKKKFVQYSDYFKEYEDVFKVREGYFAVDKKKQVVEVEGWDSSKEDNKLKAKSQEDVDRGIELILEKKDELISFNEPLAFIFSHSALREGWDNPNVFNICTLKNGSSDIAKKQEIGRGLRLPVDIYGNRCKENSINYLTVIANDNYENFAKALQEDYNNSMNFDKNEVTPDILLNAIKNSGIPKEKISFELVNILRDELEDKGIINKKGILTKKADEIENIIFNNEILKEHEQIIKEKFIDLMIDKGTKKVHIINGDDEPIPPNRPHSYVCEEDFQKIINKLCSKLKKRAIYKVKIDKDRFIKECKDEINDYIAHVSLSYKTNIETSSTSFNESKKFVVNKEIEQTVAGDNYIHEKKSDIEIVNYIMYHTKLPRLAIIKILQGINNRNALNYIEILEEVTQKILKRFKKEKGKSVIGYEIINGYELNTAKILEVDEIDEEMLKEEKKVYITNGDKRRALNLYYRMDGKGEYNFANSLENNSNVLLFTKLKKGGFVIDTPYGNYSPDWAIVYKKPEGQVRLYFIVETKINKEWESLSDEEQVKIKCGEKHFEAISDEIQFDWVKNYDDFKTKFNVKEGI